MPEVKIDQSALERLQKHAKQLDISVGELIQRAINAFENTLDIPKSSRKSSSKKPRPSSHSPKPSSVRKGNTVKGLESSPTKTEKPIHGNKGRDLVRRIDPKNLPSLKHTEVAMAKINGRRIDDPNWNKLVKQMIVRALRKKISVEDIRGMCSANVVAGKRNVEGFRPIEGVDASYQNLSSNRACKTILILAKRLNAEVDIGIIWENKPEAKFPGQRRKLLFNRKPISRS